MALWKARLATVTIGNAIASPNTTTDFKTALEAVGSNEITIEKVAKNIEFKEPEVTTEEVKLLGATAGNQNQELDPQAPTKGEFTGTLLLNPEDDNDLDMEQFKLTISGTIATGFDKRYNYASAPPSAGVAVVITMNAGTGKPIINFLLNNATIETLGGMKLDADGHAEQDVKITSAADDCWKEWELAQ